MDLQDWTPCQVHGHNFAEGKCSDCPEVQDVDSPGISQNQRDYLRSVVQPAAMPAGTRLAELWGTRLKITTGFGNVERQTVVVSRNVAAVNFEHAHRLVLEYALEIGLGVLLADKEARVHVDIHLGPGVFS